MKVLKDNYQTTESIDESTHLISYPRKLTCEKCQSELEYEKDDLRMGMYGCMFIDCPLCGYENMLDNNELNIAITRDNIEFPVHFYHTSKENGAIDTCNNEEVKQCVYKAIEYFRDNKDKYSWFTCYGNLNVRVDRYDGDENYEVTVTKDYYTTYIPFEAIDY